MWLPLIVKWSELQDRVAVRFKNAWHNVKDNARGNLEKTKDCLAYYHSIRDRCLSKYPSFSASEIST